MLLSVSSCTILAWYSTPCIPYELVVRSKDMISFKLNILARIPPRRCPVPHRASHQEAPYLCLPRL